MAITNAKRLLLQALHEADPAMASALEPELNGTTIEALTTIISAVSLARIAKSLQDLVARP